MTAPLLICNPAEPGWQHGVAYVTQVADFCRHPVTVSAAGVGRLLLTPGMQTVCVRCIPPDVVYGGVLPEVAQQFEEEMGRPLNGTDEAKMLLIAAFVARRNGRFRQ